MKFGRYIALSIVTCGMLCEATTYNNWNGGNFSDGDVVDIAYTFQTQTATILNTSINLASGTLTANINAQQVIPGTITGGLVGNFNGGNINFGSTGSTIKFNITKGTNAIGITDAFRFSSTTFTADANLNINTNASGGAFTVLNASNGSMSFNGDLTISGNASTAISTSGTTLKINQNGGNSINITGAINANNGTTSIKLDDKDKITGNFSGNGGNSNLTLEIDNSTYSGNVTNSGTSTITLNNNGKLEGKLTTSGTSLTLTMNQGTITQGVTSTATTNTISLKNGSAITANGLTVTGTNNSLTINGDTKSTITGNVSLTANNGGSNTTSLTNATITGNLTLSGTNQNPITINNSNISGIVTTNKEANFAVSNNSTINKISHTGGAFTATVDGSTITNGITSNSGINKNSLTISNNSTLGDVSLTTTDVQKGANTLDVQNGKVGNITLQAGNGQDSNVITTNNNSTINKVTTQGQGGLSFLLQGSSSVTNGVHTSTTSIKVDIAAIGSSKINGTSELAGADEVRVVFKEQAGGGTLNFKGANTNNLIARPNNGTQTTSHVESVTMQGTTNQILTENSANLTIGSLSMSGQNNTIAQTDGGTALQQNGANLTITGNATVSANAGGSNQLAFKTGNIAGSLTTSGQTNLYTLNSYHIQGGVIHSNGEFHADLYDSSQISEGIQTSGTGNSVINLKENSKINGDSNLGSVQNNITLTSSAQINGNTTFSGTTNSLTASGDSQITGQVISQKGTTTHTLSNNAKIIGGIDTLEGAGQTTANFSDNSKLQNGTSTFLANIDITFSGNSQANNEQFNINAGVANITFKDNAQMEGGKITTNGGTSVINFEDSSKMINGEIATTGGTATLTASTNAQLSNKLTQSGGTFTANFNDNSTFTGNGTQSGGTSNITFKNQAKWTGNFTQSGADSNSIITFHGTANMEGNIVTENGETNITFDDRAFIIGDVKAQGTKNKVTFTDSLLKGNLTLDGLGGGINGNSEAAITRSQITGNIQGYDKVDITISGSQVDGYLHQGGSYNTQGMKAIITDSLISGGFQGKNEQTNTLEITHSQIDNGIEEIGGFLNANIKTTVVTGGFKGSQNSQNNVTMDQGSLKGGITQDTGSLDFLSQGTDFISSGQAGQITNGFLGTNSTNTLKMANGDFGTQHIKQVNGSLKAELVSMTNVQNLYGTNSANTISLTQTEINNAIQDGGSLNLLTYSNINGIIKGTNNSQNKVQAIGSIIKDNITQDTGSMELYLTNSNAGSQEDKKIEITNARFGLYADNSTIRNINLINSTSTGVSSSTTLTGIFTQTGGTSTMTFSDSHFTNTDSIKFTDTTSASLIFTKSDIKNVSATRGVSTLNLSNSQMQNFTGNSGNHTVMLTTSTGGDFSQNSGSLAVSGAATSKINSLTGNNANITLNLNNQSEVTTNVTNTNGNTSISLQDSKISGNLEQTSGNLTLTADNSEILGHYKQIDGGTSVNFSHSFIKSGVDLENITQGSVLTFAQESEVNQGFKVSNSNISLSLLSSSKITDGFSQNGGLVTGLLNDHSSISGDQNTAGLTLENATTSFTLYNQSKIENGIKATNNATTILIDNSQINGNITIERGSLDLTAQNNSTITSPQMSVNNANLKLTVDTNSKFIGDLTQTNNKQEIIIKQDSVFQGGITNTNTTGTITINHASLTGSLTQNGGTLGLELSNNGKIGGNVTLTNANTTLSGSGIGNEIGGNFSQSNGMLKGGMNGLTLKGTYSQTGGTSDVNFTNSTFQSDTTITTATSSSLSFDNSTLKNYTIDGGANNTLKLLNSTTMTGNLTLTNQATATLKMQDSKIVGNINASNDSFLNFNTLNSKVTGTTTINTGGLTGVAENTTFGGDFTLTDTTSDVSFINKTSITGNLTATGEKSNNKVKFDNSSITGSISQTSGQIDLELSNGSNIETDLTFTNTTAHFTGLGAGNQIGGNFLSQNTTLKGDVSGLTLKGTFTQNQGTSDITFRNESNFNGLVKITDATSSNIKFENQSGIKANIQISNGDDNNLSLSNGSYITGDTTLQNTTATITANNNSLITGNIDAGNSNTLINLDSSNFEGDITQTNGSMTLKGSNNSSFVFPNLFTIKADANPAITNVQLNGGSSLSGNITATNSNLTFSIDKASLVGEEANPSNIDLTDSTLSITVQNSSIFNANITDKNTSTQKPFKTANINLQSNSTLNGALEFSNIDVTASLNSSTLNSESIKAINGDFNLSYTNSPNGGVIGKFEATNTNLAIQANNSTAFINELIINGNTLDLLAENNARLTIRSLNLEPTTKATYTARTNGNLNVNTHIGNNGSTLTTNIEGGILQGSITQIDNRTGEFRTGDITLQSMGDLGGRFAPTDDSQIHSLTLNNNEDVLYTNALFSSVFNNPMSYVDFTLDFDDTQSSSRVGKALLNKPTPQQGEPIPPAPAGSTYVRQLQVENLRGNNGLFRVYTDLGANLADNIVANTAEGNHIIQVQYRAETFREIGSDRIVVAKVKDPTTTVSFKGTQSEIGLTRYDTEIIKENAQDGGFEWIIGQATPSGMSYSSKIIASLLQSQYRNFMVEVDSLDRRMGDLRFIKRDLGVWMRAYIGEGKKKANDFSTAVKDNYYSVWAGADYNSIGLTVHNFAGIFFNYTALNSQSKDYSGSGYNIGIGFYDTFKAFSGFYADFLIKYIYSSNSFEINNYALAKNKPTISNHKFLLNAEIGYTFYYGERLKSGYIEPQFQVTSGYIDQVSLELMDVSGETIYGTMARNFPITMRAGVFWGQVFGEKIKSHIKLGSSFAYDVNSGGNLHFKDSSTQLNFKQEGDFRMLLSAQTDFTFNDFFKLYASIDTSFFGDYNITYSANLGLRMTFGRPNNHVRSVPLVYNPYTPPVVIDDDTRTVPVVKRFTTKDIDQNYSGKPRKIESQIRGNPQPQSNNKSQEYVPMRKSIRDMTEVEF